MKLRAFLLAATLLLPGTVFAQGLNYNYLQLNYEILTDPDVHYWGLKGSYEVSNNIYAFLEDKGTGFYSRRVGGAGYYFPVQSNLHLYGQFGLGDSGDGFRPVLEGGVRMALNQQFEVRGYLQFADSGASNGENEFLFGGEGLYHLNQKVDLVAGLAIPTEDDGVILQLGARLNF